MVEFDEDISAEEKDSGTWFFASMVFRVQHPEPKSYTFRQVDITREMLKSGDIHDILEPVFRCEGDWNTAEERDQNVAHLSAAQRRLYAVWWYEAQVNNGGHEHFYSSSYGMLWQEAIDGLDAIGAQTTKQILVDSIARFAEPPSRDRARRNEQKDGLDFDDLDTRFFAGADDLDALMRRFMLAHPEDFLFSGKLRYENPSEYKCVYGKNGFRWERRTE